MKTPERAKAWLQRLAANRRLRLAAWWIGGVLVFIAVAGFLVAPPIVRSQLEKQLGEALHRPVTVERVTINPFTLNATVQGVRVGERQGSDTAFSVDALHVNIAYRSLARLALVADALRVTRPHLRLVRNEDRTYNFQDLMDEFAARPPDPEPGAPPKFAVYNIEVVDGRVDFDDRPEKTQHAVTEIGLGVPFVSSIPKEVDIRVQPRLSAKIDGALFEVGGTTKPFKDTHETTLRFSLADLQVAKYLEYSPVPLRLRLPAGALDADLEVSLATAGEVLQTLAVTGKAALRNVAVQTADGAPLVAWEALQVDLDTLDLVGRKAVVKAITLQRPVINAARTRDGKLDWLGLVEPAPQARPTSAAPPAKPAGGTPQEEAPFALNIAALTIDGGKGQFLDRSTPEPFKLVLETIALSLRDISQAGERNAPLRVAGVTLAVTTDAKGKVDFDGALQVAPLKVDGKVAVEGFRLPVLAAYYDQWLNVIVNDGALATKGTIALEQPSGQALRGTFRGDAAVTRFASRDKKAGQDLLRWKSLDVSGIDVRLEPFAARVKQVTLADFYSRLIVQADGTLNLQHVVKDAEEKAAGDKPRSTPATTEKRAGRALPVSIGHVVLKEGRVSFSDYFVKPNYSADLSRVRGNVSEMTPQKAGDLMLRANIGRSSPLVVQGSINPFAPELFLDINARAREIELPPLSPYAVKYAGYGIEKGKLSLKVSYHLENRQLRAENNIYLDQLTFGPPVESPTATKLPVTLAIALLKDRNGVIDIDLPISGSLDDPQFSIGAVIGRALLNLLTRIVTAPFALLGNLVGGGGGPDLSYLEFAAGRASLSNASEEKLEKLAKALEQRPALKVEVSGRADPAVDRDGLKRVALERLLNAQRQKQAKGKEKDEAAKKETRLSDLKLDPGEYAKLLTAVYRDAKFERPRNALGFLRDLPVPEMEKLMLANLPASDQDLNALATARAQVVKEWLAGAGKIPADRVLLGAPKLDAEGIKDEGRTTRAEFSIK